MMAFLAPALLAGLAALAVPIYLHLVQRERRVVVEFPSLMFLRKIPYKSVRRRKVRNLVLLLLRCAALALVVMAFARPFFGSGALAAAGGLGSRDVVILLDKSYSMGYGNHWDRAKDAARAVIGRLAPEDRATVVLFDTGAEIGPRTTMDRAALLAFIDRATVGGLGTKYAAALKVAASLVEASDLPRHEVVLITDFQKLGWDRSQSVALPPATTLTPMPVGESGTADVGIAGLVFEREVVSGRERMRVTARLTNRSREAVSDREVSLEVDGRRVETGHASLEPNGSAAVTFEPFAVPAGSARGVVRLAADALAADDVFQFVVSPGASLPVLIVDGVSPAPDASLYLTRALAVGHDPSFDARVVRVNAVSADDISRSAVVVLNDTSPPGGAAGRALGPFVERGGGLLVALGEHSTWPDGAPDLLPGSFGPPIDRVSGRGATFGFINYSHPVFEIFAAPRSGDLTAARFFRYRPLGSPDDAIARFDDGTTAVAERRFGNGRVLVWTSTLDTFWNDLALKPVFLPLVHQTVKYLAAYVPPLPSYTVGATIDAGTLERARREHAADASTELTLATPSGRRVSLGAGVPPEPMALVEPGFYELHVRDSAASIPAFAANVDAAEADLTPLDPAELVAAATAAPPGSGEPALPVTAEERERQQSVWWYLLLAGVLLLLIETAWSNRLPRTVG
jgi:hypothetical protein